MNRRAILSLSAIPALGLALLPGRAVAQEAADVDGVKAASKAFYAALEHFPERLNRGFP